VAGGSHEGDGAETAAARRPRGRCLVAGGALAAALLLGTGSGLRALGPRWAGGAPAIRAVRPGPAAAADTSEQGSGPAARTGADASEAAAPARIRVERAASAIDVDGVLDESAWRSARTIRMPWEFSPGDGTPAPVKTECRVTYDGSRLYIGCHAFDPHPGRIRAHLADRDRAFDDDRINIILDPFGDHRRGYEFLVNPLGVPMDGLRSPAGEDFSWDAIWDSKGRVTADGYVVEVAIPFKALDFPENGDRSSWGIILARHWPRSVSHELASIRVDPGNSCLMCQAQHLEGLHGLQSGHDVELDPTVTSKRADARDSLAAPAIGTGAVHVHPGITGHWGMTSNLNLDLTVNPDFSQVEADVAQLQTNRQFAVFYPEKRPFFQQGSDIFDVPGHLVNTRTVVDPTAGVKLAGKVGPWAVGAFYAHDRENRILVPGNQSSQTALLPEDVDGGVFRVRRDLGQASYLGLTITDREAGDYHNRLAFLDGLARVDDATTVAYGYVHTDTRYPSSLAAAAGQPAGSFGGNAGYVSVNRSTRDWHFHLEGDDFGPEFRADAGFFPQVDLRGGSANAARYLWGGPDDVFSRISLGVSSNYMENHDGRVFDRSVELHPWVQGPLQSELGFHVSWSDQRFGDRLFPLSEQGVSFSMQPSGAFSFGVDASRGTTIDYAGSRRADDLTLSPELTWRSGRHAELQASHDLERLTVGGEALSTENLSQLELRYHFSLRAFLRAILQYRHSSRNPDLYPRPVASTSRHLFTQLLFSYKLNPRTVLFAGYSGDRQGVRADGRAIGLTQTGRTFFVKLGYAFRP